MKLLKSTNSILFLITVFISSIAGIFINFKLDFIFGDALARSFHSYMVFFGYEPKFSAIGFVWPPLQTILELPLVLIKPLNTYGIAGNILSSLFFGITVVYMNRLANFFKVNKIIKSISLLLFATNPLIFFYGINGMSEMIGICFMLMTLYYFLQYIQKKTIPPLIFSSLALACSIMTRWETGIFLLTILPVMMLIPLIDKKQTFREIESSFVLYVVPVAFTILIWLTTCWLITGSFFPGAAQLETDEGRGNFIDIKIIQYALERLFFLSPLFIVFLGISLRKFIKKLPLEILTIFGFSASLLLVQTLLFSLGRSVGELRYFISIIPFTYVFLFMAFKDTLAVSLKKFIKIGGITFFTIGLIASSLMTFYLMSSAKYNNQEHVFIEALVNKHNNSQYYNYSNDKKIAKYISSHINTHSILIDDSEGFSIIYFTQKPYLFIQTVDKDYEKTLKNPVASNAKYILIDDVTNLSTLNTLNLTYPKLYKEGGDFVTLEKDFGKWKLYKVKTPAEKLTENLQNFQLAQSKKKITCEHIIIYGESLWSISKKYFGSGKNYENIQNQNKELIIDTHIIHPGDKISVPCVNVP